MPADEPPVKAPSDFVDEAYHLENAQEMVGFYHKWAADYDHQMLDQLGYTAPGTIAAILSEHLPDTQASILDIGCGTGLTCRLLAERGFSNLDGIDLSVDMLGVAGERGIYRDLLQGDVNQPLALETASYDGAISSGTFTHGHVGPEPLDEIFRVLKPGAILACTVHQDLWQSMGFEAKFSTLSKQGVASLISLELDSYYRDNSPEGWFCVYRKT
ncbi:methyltransferase domain-containing protein [Gammaproteobacteria bacterium]|nr:methyltransferase domain-containing protein [Gammaproteobacteria bacterium]